MSERKIDLKTPWVAGVLGFLIPGAGHFYQGRNLKGAIYSVGIIGTFLFGMFLGEWRPVYWTESAAHGQTTNKNLGFVAQAGFGTPAIFACVQSRRFHSHANQSVLVNFTDPRDNREINPARLGNLPLTETIDADFTGTIVSKGHEEPVSGRLHLEPMGGTFRGTLTTASKTLQLGHKLMVDSRILGDPRRTVEAGIVGINRNENDEISVIRGSIPRSFGNWFLAPLDEQVLEDVNRRLNKLWEMALVFTWIAGLLNILAVWDAVQGPAYGFGDETAAESSAAGKTDRKQDGKKPAATSAVATETPQPAEAKPPAQVAEPVASKTGTGESKSPEVPQEKR